MVDAKPNFKVKRVVSVELFESERRGTCLSLSCVVWGLSLWVGVGPVGETPNLNPTPRGAFCMLCLSFSQGRGKPLPPA